MKGNSGKGKGRDEWKGDEGGEISAHSLSVIIFSVVNTSHLSKLFENDRHFSHLADFEREMTYRTEMVRKISTMKRAFSHSTSLRQRKIRINANPAGFVLFVLQDAHHISIILRWNNEDHER